MPAKHDEDPLSLSGIDADSIRATIEAKKEKPAKKPSELEVKKEERLNAKEARLANKQPVGEEGYSTSTENRTKLMDKITAYKERFPTLKTRNKTLKTEEDMLDELHYLELQLGSGKDNALASTLFVMSMTTVEHMVDVYNPLGLNLTGLGQVAKNNLSEFLPLLDELSIKYGGSLYMPVEYRLCLAVGSLVYTVHLANSDPKVAQALHKAHTASQSHADL